jgi:hypothetical protein
LSIYRDKLSAPTVATCPFRRDVRARDDTETATCKLLEALLGLQSDRWCQVGRDACEACCRSFPPSTTSLNPVVASLVYHAGTRIAAGLSPGDARDRIEATARRAAEALNVVHPAAERVTVARPASGRPLRQLVPAPMARHGKIDEWAVGVTTAPRREPTLEACLESIARAGWDRPYLFVDGAVRIPERFGDLRGTFRDEKLGAWPSYYLALTELLMRQPHADAYLIVQDDVVFFDRENLREYLEEALWPGETSPLVSLYCAQPDARPEPGWHCRQGWVAGAHAFVFPPPLAKHFLTDRPVFDHRWADDPVWACCVDDVMHHWAKTAGIDVWFPSPSLAQHIGESSTLWPHAGIDQSRRADRFAGEL